jgi:hypothetical protein
MYNEAWIICTPALLSVGVNCDEAPRRPATTYSHEHLVGISTIEKATQVLREEEDEELCVEQIHAETKLAEIAYRTCLDLGIPLDDGTNVAYHAQMMIFLRSMQIMMDRGKEYGQAFEEAGWAGSLVDLKRKFQRLWIMGWTKYVDGDLAPYEGGDRAPGKREAMIDNALDLINHAGFMIQGIESNNRSGR